MIRAALLVNPDVWSEAKWRGLIPKSIPVPKSLKRTNSLRRMLSRTLSGRLSL
jgi:hypothetical protein